MKNFTCTAIDNNTNNLKKNPITIDEPNYSKILDALIATNIVESNPYLKKYTACPTAKIIGANNATCPLKGKNNCLFNGSTISIFATYSNFFNPKNTSDIKVDHGKTIHLNGHIITFFDDEIVIDGEIYSLKSSFFDILKKAFSTKKKNTIIDIHTKAGNTISINIAA